MNHILKNKKLYLIVIGAFIIIGVFGLSYAYLVPQIGAGAGTNVNLLSKTVDKLSFTKGSNLSLVASQTLFTEGGQNLTSTTTSTAKLIANNETNTATDSYNVYFNIADNNYTYTTNNNTPEIILTVTSPTGLVTEIPDLTYVTQNGVSGFDITTKTGLIKIATNYVITTNSSTTGTTQSWTVTLSYINLPTNQAANAGSTFTSELILKKVIPIQANTTATRLSSTYSNVTNMVSDGNGNFRYSGAYDDVNNWICFGSTASTCPVNNLYRIIGVFNLDGVYKYKLIQGDFATTAELGTPYNTGTKNSSYPGHTNQTTINVYQWNTEEGVTWGSGTTCNASLCTLLNNTYLTNIGSTWSNKIATSTWYTYTNSSASSKAANILLTEEKASSAYTGKVGLMSLSDYHYGSTSEYWSSNINTNYENRILNDWLYNGDYYEWTIAQYDTSLAWFVAGDGDAGGYNLYYGRAVRPVLYLSSGVSILSGTGTTSNPYRIV